MELRQTLIDISNDARAWLKAWAGDFTEAQAGATRPGAPHCLLWHLGHLAAVEDDVAALFGTGGHQVPASVRAVCASGCPPPGPDTAWPSLAESWQRLDQTHARLLALIEDPGANLDRESDPPNRFFRTLGQAVYEAALHENYHVGEIAALRRALGMRSIG